MFIAYSSIDFCETREHVLVASFFFVFVLLDFLLADRDLVDGSFIIRL